MKRQKREMMRLAIVCAALMGGTLAARADKVPLAQVPAAVQKAIKAQAQGETVQDVERETQNGQNVYEAEFKREGINRRVKFAEDGSVLPNGNAAGAFKTEPTVALNQLPTAVQKTIREQQAGRTVEDIDKETWNGQTVYEVEFKERGPNSRIHIAPDGTLVMDKPGAVKSMFKGTQLSDTPKPVQAAVKRLAGSAEIADVDKETWQGRPAYEVEISREGMNREILLAEDGSLLRDSDNPGATAAGRERVRERETTSRDILGRETLTLSQLPGAVQTTIKAQGELGTLKPIHREQKNGQNAYAVEFEKDGKNTRLTIAEDGRVLEDNRR
jgi:uncharacterized membrane protein YkoI